MFFFVKAALALIPATVILMLIAMALGAVIAAIFGAGHFDFMMRRWPA